MARVSIDDVKQIIGTSLCDNVIDAFILAANQIVTKHLGTSTALSNDQRVEIERWLTAHLLASTREQQAQAEDADKARIIYQGKTGMGLDFTSYGQMVKLLDTTGTLAAVAGKQAVMVYAVPTPEFVG